MLKLAAADCTTIVIVLAFSVPLFLVFFLFKQNKSVFPEIREYFLKEENIFLNKRNISQNKGSISKKNFKWEDEGRKQLEPVLDHPLTNLPVAFALAAVLCTHTQQFPFNHTIIRSISPDQMDLMSEFQFQTSFFQV